MQPGSVKGRVAWICCILAASGCQSPRKASAPGPQIRFTDVSAQAGIHFRHAHGGSGKKLMPETVGSGCAWLDYDGDGWQDMVLINCSPLPGTRSDKPATSKLYRNRGDGTFEDRTAGSGLETQFYGQGVVAADYDADGDPDILITCLGPNRLFRNEGSGRFKDVTQNSGLQTRNEPWRWHAGAAWLDFDRDGKLDLFLARYVKWTPETDVFCGVPGGLKRYCPPWKYSGEQCALFRNLGDGKFQDVSSRTGIENVTGKWFQPLVTDANHDGWPDVMVSSDGTPTALFLNERGRRFTDASAELGLGLSGSGAPKSAMGIDVADWRNNGQDAVLIGNFSGDKLSFFQADENGTYTDLADNVGMGTPSLYSLTFGLAFIDVDLDGWRDAIIGNGHIDDYIERFDSQVTYAQRTLLFHNLRGERFAEVGLQSGALVQKLVARGMALADYDQDGDPDVLVTENNRGARLYRNDTQGSHWLRIVLRGGEQNREAIGATVEVLSGGIRQKQSVRAGGHFFSQSELPLTFGLGIVDHADVKVTWPDGLVTESKNVPAGRTFTLRKNKELQPSE